MLVLAAAAAAGASAIVAWLIDRRGCRQRNEQGECAACGLVWGKLRSDNTHLIHGRLVCESCAEEAKRRLVWQFGTLAAAAAVATGFIIADKGVAAMILLPASSTILMTAGAARLMKLANRDEQRRIALGESSDFKLLDSQAGGRELPGDPAV